MEQLRQFDSYATVTPEIGEYIEEHEKERIEAIRKQAQDYEECESNISLHSE